jgi:homoserine dehydrogenase
MRIAIAGLGTVGAATLRLLRVNRGILAARTCEMTVVAVSARNREKPRTCDLASIDWVDDVRDLATRSDIDTVVEVIGGAEGAALELAKAALTNGKHLVTANKAMIAAHGVELARIAEGRNVQLAFEAAVCGGVPIIKTLREGLAANRISEIRGIFNGTCNFILTRMGVDGIDFDTALHEAQECGYAEADPSSDIDGHDSANKLAIVAALAFDTAPAVASIVVEGIRGVSLHDMQMAAGRGGTIKLLGIARRSDGGIIQRVKSVFVPYEQMLSGVIGVTNAIEITGDFVGDLILQGPGAGGNATASAIVADLVDIGRGHIGPAFGVPADRLA